MAASKLPKRFLPTQAGELPTVAAYADLPASVSGSAAILYYVQSDTNNENDPSIYALLGTTKVWLASKVM